MNQQTFDVISPLTGEVIKSYPIHSRTHIREQLSAARAAQAKWMERLLKDRVGILKPLLKQITTGAEEIQSILRTEVGKSETDAFAEYMVVYSFINYYRHNAHRILKDTKVHHPFFKIKRSVIRHEPYGVVAVITPWNYPFHLAITPVLTAILAGNAVMFKPSELTSVSGEWIRDLLIRSGVPADLLQIVYGDGKTGAALVDSNVDKISFTGSNAVGEKIYQSAAKRMIPVSLELGGNDAMIVAADADLDRAVNGAIWGSSTNCGQSCSCVERIIVDKRIADQFKAKLREAVAGLETTGEGRVLTTLNNRAVFEKVTRHLADAQGKSSEIIQTEMDSEEPGLFKVPIGFVIEPSIDAAILTEETFGPLAAVQIADDLEDAIRIANDTPYGLTASIWTASTKTADYVASRMKVGSVTVNDHVMSQAIGELPWGGAKKSGIGRLRGDEGLLGMTYSKVVNYDRLKLKRDLWWPPYSAATVKKLKILLPLMRLAYRLKI